MNEHRGYSKSPFTTIGATGHFEGREENDYYATSPKAVEMLLDLERFDKCIWEPACGEGYIAKVLKDHNHIVRCTDLIDRGFGEGHVDFLKCTKPWNGDIITNPPYKYAKEFVEKALALIPNHSKVAMFLKIQFLEGKARKKLFEKYPPKCVYVSSSRLKCARNGVFRKGNDNNAMCYAWFVWEKGFNGEPVIRWFN